MLDFVSLSLLALCISFVSIFQTDLSGINFSYHSESDLDGFVSVSAKRADCSTCVLGLYLLSESTMFDYIQINVLVVLFE